MAIAAVIRRVFVTTAFAIVRPVVIVGVSRPSQGRRVLEASKPRAEVSGGVNLGENWRAGMMVV